MVIFLAALSLRTFVASIS